MISGGNDVFLFDQSLGNEFSEGILTQHFRRQERGSLDEFQASAASAKANKGLSYFPFSGRIKKGQFLSRADITEAHQFFFVGIQKHIGVATVVEVLQAIRIQGDVLVFTRLNGEVGGFAQRLSGKEGADDIAFFDGPSAVELMLAVVKRTAHFQCVSLENDFFSGPQ